MRIVGLTKVVKRHELMASGKKGIMMADEKVFIDGMIVKRKPKAPSFVKCSLSFKCKDFIEFAKKHHNGGWLNVDIKLSKGNKLYAELDTWKPEGKTETKDDDSWNEQPPATDEQAESGQAKDDDGFPF